MPKLTVFRNPPKKRKAARAHGAKRGGVLSNKALEICYIHAGDGKPYRHVFKAGVTIEFLPDGSALFYRKDGLPVWKDF